MGSRPLLTTRQVEPTSFENHLRSSIDRTKRAPVPGLGIRLALRVMVHLHRLASEREPRRPERSPVTRNSTDAVDCESEGSMHPGKTDLEFAEQLLRIAEDPDLRWTIYERLGEYCHRCRNQLNSLKLSIYLARKQSPASRPCLWTEIERDYQVLEQRSRPVADPLPADNAVEGNARNRPAVGRSSRCLDSPDVVERKRPGIRRSRRTRGR